MTLFETLRGIYQTRLDQGAGNPAGQFPNAPREKLSAQEFVSRLIVTAAEQDARATHPFLRRIAAGQYHTAQLREWVRQNYQSVLGEIRRNAMLAATAQDCDQLRALLSLVGMQADADPVGGAYFSLPQLWIKFGISLGLTREEITKAKPAPDLLRWNEKEMAAARDQRSVPVEMLVRSLLDPALAWVLGARLRQSLKCERNSLDYFWAIAGNRWGEDAGLPTLESWSAEADAQRQLWDLYVEERSSDRNCERLSILQRVVESAADESS
jgi:hypothetical protein